MATLITVTSCGDDDEIVQPPVNNNANNGSNTNDGGGSNDDGNNDGNNGSQEVPEIVVVVNEDGTTSNGSTFLPIDDNNFYIDFVRYSVKEGHLAVSGYDKAGFKGAANIISRLIYKNNTYEMLEIGGSAFYGCNSLTAVTIPKSVTTIGLDAFSYCGKLTSVTVAKESTWIDSRDNCNAIIETATNKLLIGCKNTTIPSSVTSIGNHAFYGCSSMTSITIPNSVTSIGNHAFYGCSSMTSITIPNSVAGFGDYAFSYCTNLTSVTLESNSIVSESRDENSSMKSVFGEQVKTYVIGNEVTSIGENAFYECTSLTSVTIGNSVTSIGGYAFSNCSGLTSVTVAKESTWIDSRDNCNAIIETATNKLLIGCKNTTIPSSVTSIGNYAFYGCSSMTSITIPNSVAGFGDYAFYDCTSLTSITIPNSVTSIGSNTFSKCTNLTSVTLESNSIVSESRDENSSMKSVFGEQVKTYVIGNEVTRIGNYAFKGCKSLTSITIGNSVTSIGGYAFSNCSGLTSVTIPNSVTSIGWGAFSNCSSLTSVTIGNSVTSIGLFAFDYCTRLTDVYCYAENAPSTDSSAFKDSPIYSATLHVPAGSIDEYKSQSPWSRFSRIVAIE